VSVAPDMGGEPVPPAAPAPQTPRDRERWAYADLVEAAEQTVRRYEELELGLDLAAAGA
jgi:hypothetical protein